MRILLFISLSFYFIACQSPKKKASEEIEERQMKILIHELPSPSYESLRGICVVDSETVWLSGAAGTILRTVNAGEKWQVLNAPDTDGLDFRDVHAFSANEALISSAGFPARIYRTIDAGESWNLVYENLDSSAFLNSVHFKDAQNGIIVGDALGGYHFVLETNDAGKSWKRIDSALLPKPLKAEHAFAASGSNITIDSEGNFLIAFGGIGSRVMRRNANGEWEVEETNLGDSASTSGIYSMANGNGRIMVVGGDYTKPNGVSYCFFSDDNASSWTKGGKVGGYRSIVDYSSKDRVWLTAGTNGLEYSTDGGLNWQKTSTGSFNTLQFDDISGRAWATGTKGQLYVIEVEEQEALIEEY